VGWLKKGRKLERGTQRWKDLHDCLQSFATDMWRYYDDIDDGDWDLRQVHMRIAEIEADLHLAQQIWPEGKPILERLTRLFVAQIQVREDEHRIITHPYKWDFNNPKKYQKQSARALQAMEEVEKKLDSIGKEMFDCCDEIKKWTSIDVSKWLEEGVS